MKPKTKIYLAKLQSVLRNAFYYKAGRGFLMSHILLAIFPTHRLHAMSFKRAWGASRRFEGASSGDVEKRGAG